MPLHFSNSNLLPAQPRNSNQPPHSTASCHCISSNSPLPCWLCSLAGALGLERLTESLVDALAQAAGVSQPAQPGTPGEAKQVAALEALLQLAMGPRAGLLGSGWVVVLRTLSALEALQVSAAVTSTKWVLVLCSLSALETLQRSAAVTGTNWVLVLRSLSASKTLRSVQLIYMSCHQNRQRDQETRPGSRSRLWSLAITCAAACSHAANYSLAQQLCMGQTKLRTV